MNATKLIGAILIILSLGIGYVGFNKIADSSNSVNILGVQIDATSESGKEQGYLYLGLAILLFVGGIYTVNKARN
ncbi:MAG TPA: hypothetical protein VLR29_10955 [Flavobacterium sp.]|nr:hypothetical protein [Flavobacterium sp.]